MSGLPTPLSLWPFKMKPFVLMIPSGLALPSDLPATIREWLILLIYVMFPKYDCKRNYCPSKGTCDTYLQVTDLYLHYISQHKLL